MKTADQKTIPDESLAWMAEDTNAEHQREYVLRLLAEVNRLLGLECILAEACEKVINAHKEQCERIDDVGLVEQFRNYTLAVEPMVEDWLRPAYRKTAQGKGRKS